MKNFLIEWITKLVKIQQNDLFNKKKRTFESKLKKWQKRKQEVIPILPWIV
jgi:hypothetical protein